LATGLSTVTITKVERGDHVSKGTLALISAIMKDQAEEGNHDASDS